MERWDESFRCQDKSDESNPPTHQISHGDYFSQLLYGEAQTARCLVEFERLVSSSSNGTRCSASVNSVHKQSACLVDNLILPYPRVVLHRQVRVVQSRYCLPFHTTLEVPISIHWLTAT